MGEKTYWGKMMQELYGKGETTQWKKKGIEHSSPHSLFHHSILADAISVFLRRMDLNMWDIFKRDRDRNLTENRTKTNDWDEFLERIELYFEANNITDENKQKAILLTKIDAETYSIIKKVCAPKKPKETSLEDITIKMGNYVKSKVNETVLRCDPSAYIRGYMGPTFLTPILVVYFHVCFTKHIKVRE